MMQTRYFHVVTVKITKKSHKKIRTQNMMSEFSRTDSFRSSSPKSPVDTQDSFEEEDIPPVIDWEPYQEAGVLTPLERKRMDEVKHNLDINSIVKTVQENSNEYVELFIKLLFSIHQNETLKSVLYLIDLIFQSMLLLTFIAIHPLTHFI
jgi:hypothetical protein